MILRHFNQKLHLSKLFDVEQTGHKADAITRFLSR